MKTMVQPLIQFKDVFKQFGDSQELRGVNLCIYQGEITTIIGKSGEGKSVLLKHMIGLMHPDAGEIVIDGRPLSNMKLSEIDKLREKFSYVFQDAALFDAMTVYDNIDLPLREGTSKPKSEIRNRVESQLQLFELEDVQDKYPAQISGGMKRRVALEKPRDALTGMATQLQGERRFQEELARLQSDQITFSAVMLTVENLDELNENIGAVAGQIMLKNFAAQIKQRLDITDSCSRYSLDRILVVLHNADMDEARRFATRLARELNSKDLLNSYEGADVAIRISAGYAQADEDSLIKEVLARAESKDSRYVEFELN